MEFLHQIVDIFLHLDQHLDQVCQQYGAWTYLLLFAIVFCETGLVVTPFLPGDSLLFAAGALAGRGALDPWAIFFLLTSAAILGDNSNYWIGRLFGRKLIQRPNRRFLKQEHLDKTHAYFERYGGKTIIIAQFVPIVRTFAPFVAGLGAMTYGAFLRFNVIGVVLWVGICDFAGYFFGSREFVKNNFSLVVFAIIGISLLPAVIEFLRHRAAARREGSHNVGEPPLGAREPHQPQHEAHAAPEQARR